MRRIPWHTDVREADLRRVSDLRVLAVSDQAGLYMASGAGGRMIYVMGHPEYDRETLKAEYERDRAKGLPIAVPARTSPATTPRGSLSLSWRSHAHLLYANWLNYCVYQATPYDLGGALGDKGKSPGDAQGAAPPVTPRRSMDDGGTPSLPSYVRSSSVMESEKEPQSFDRGSPSVTRGTCGASSTGTAR